MSVKIESEYWEAEFTQVSFSRGSSIPAIKLTLKSDLVNLMVYELGNGVNIATVGKNGWRTDSGHTVYSGVLTDTNRGFVEAHVNPTLRAEPLYIGKKKGASLVRQGKQSPETDDFFSHHLPLIKGMLDSSKRNVKLERMKALVKDLGDLSEEEMLDLWREARAEEVMSS
jgi:hypothetical protein